MSVNGNGHLPVTSPASLNNPVEAATILKVYYGDLLSQAEQVVAELEDELAKARTKRDATKQLAEQAEQMLQRIQQFQESQEIRTESPIPDVLSLKFSSEAESEEKEEEPLILYATEEDGNTQGELPLVITEDEIPPTARVTVDEDGGVDVEVLPRFERMKKMDAIAQVLEENSDRFMHRSSILQEVFGYIEDKEARKVVQSRVGAALTAGKQRGLWFVDPRNDGFYTSNPELVKSNKKAPK